MAGKHSAGGTGNLLEYSSSSVLVTVEPKEKKILFEKEGKGVF